MPSNKPPKKSEMLEVRLSYEDKQNLQRKARKNGRSVSEVVRQLITDYLTPQESRSLYQKLMEPFMQSSIKIKSSFLAAGMLVAGALIIAPLSTADDIGLKLEGNFSQPDGDGVRTRSFKTDLLVEDGESLYFNIPGYGDTIKIHLSVIENAKTVSLNIKIIEIFEDTETILAEPKLTANFDAASKIKIGKEDGKTYSLSITPSKQK